jgi:large subunit ribosomal protein L15e
VEKTLYKYDIRAWNTLDEASMKELTKERHMKWRRQPAIVRTEKPLRLSRARALGYKAKQGFVIIRVRVRRGGLRKVAPRGGRRQRHMGVTKFTPQKSMKMIAEERGNKKFPNLEVVNSYWVGEDGQYKWFEVILVDKTQLTTDENSRLLGKTPRRAYRGRTSAGKNARGLRKKRGLKTTG